MSNLLERQSQAANRSIGPIESGGGRAADAKIPFHNMKGIRTSEHSSGFMLYKISRKTYKLAVSSGGRAGMFCGLLIDEKYFLTKGSTDVNLLRH